jgi:hypothetical protein
VLGEEAVVVTILETVADGISDVETVYNGTFSNSRSSASSISRLAPVNSTRKESLFYFIIVSDRYSTIDQIDPRFTKPQ